MLSGPRNDTVGMLSGLRNESVDELTQQHASHAVAGGTRSVRSPALARRGGKLTPQTHICIDRVELSGIRSTDGSVAMVSDSSVS